MKILTAFTSIIISLLATSICTAQEFYVDPSKGTTKGNGSETQPWRTLEEVIKNNLIETKDVNGNYINQGAPIKAGSTIILKSGYHGHVQIKNAYNDDFIIVTAGINQTPQLSELEIISSKRWKFSKLTISPVFSNRAIRTSSIVSLGDINSSGNSSELELTDAYVYSFNDDPNVLSKENWAIKAKTGILLGRNADKLHLKNNFINNIDFGISILSSHSITEGNVISDFSKDGVRVSANHNEIKNNIIKNNYSVSQNHADGIQGFSLDGSGLSEISMIGNIIMNRDRKPYNHSGAMQGIGFFSPPIDNISIENNIVMSFSWHGISLYGATQSKVTDNFVYTPQSIDIIRARISLDSNNELINTNDYLANNYAHNYITKSHTKLILINNTVTKDTSITQSLFIKKLESRLDFINKEYGKYHPLSHQLRLNENIISNGISTIF